MGTEEGINFVDFYIKQLVSGTKEQKKEAAEGLVREFKSRSPPEELLSALRAQVSHNQNSETVSHSIQLLFHFRNTDSIHPIIRRVASETKQARFDLEEAAASLLGALGEDAFPALHKILAHENDFSACSATLSILTRNPSPAHVGPIAVLLARLHSSQHFLESGRSSPMAGSVKKGDPEWDTIQGISFMAAILAVEALAKIGDQKSTDALFAYVGKFTGEEKPPYSDVLFAVFDILFSSSENIRRLRETGLPPKVGGMLHSFVTRKWEDSEPLPQGGAPATAGTPGNLDEIQDFFQESGLHVVVPEGAPPPSNPLKTTKEFPRPPRPPPPKESDPSWIPKPPRAVRGPSRHTPTRRIRPPTYPIKK